MGTSSDEDYERRLGAWLATNGVLAEHLRFAQPVRSVAEAAAAARSDPTAFVKSVVLLQPDGGLVVAVVKGEDFVSRSRVARALGADEPKIAEPEEVLRRTGYPAGGVPPFGFPATFLVDERVLERAWVYAGGGSQRALLRIDVPELVRASGGRVVRVHR